MNLSRKTTSSRIRASRCGGDEVCTFRKYKFKYIAMREIKIIRVSGQSKIPSKTYSSDAGFDIYSLEDIVILQEKWASIKTGIKMIFPSDIHAEIRSRSGLALKHGIVVLNSPGTIDSDYRGEIRVVLINHGPKPYKVSVGDGIAQVIFSQHCHVKLVEGSEIDVTPRGNFGFGSG